MACAVSCLVYSNRDQRCHGSVLIINFASPESTLQGPLKRIISFVGSTDGICGFALRSEVKVSFGFHLCVLLSFGLNTFYIVMLILIWDLGDKPQRKVCGLIAVCVCCQADMGTVVLVSFMSTGHTQDLFGKGALS